MRDSLPLVAVAVGGHRGVRHEIMADGALALLAQSPELLMGPARVFTTSVTLRLGCVPLHTRLRRLGASAGQRLARSSKLSL